MEYARVAFGYVMSRPHSLISVISLMSGDELDWLEKKASVIYSLSVDSKVCFRLFFCSVWRINIRSESVSHSFQLIPRSSFFFFFFFLFFISPKKLSPTVVPILPARALSPRIHCQGPANSWTVSGAFL